MPGPEGPEAGLISTGRTPGEGVEPSTITVTARLPHHGGLPGNGGAYKSAQTPNCCYLRQGDGSRSDPKGPTGVSNHGVVAIFVGAEEWPSHSEGPTGFEPAILGLKVQCLSS